jgi:hypothetical protein
MKKIMLVISMMSLMFMHLQTFASQPSKSSPAWAVAKPIIGCFGILWGTITAVGSAYIMQRAPKDAQHIKKIREAATNERDDRIRTITENTNALSNCYAIEKQYLIEHAQYMKEQLPNNASRGAKVIMNLKALPFDSTLEKVEKRNNHDNSKQGRRDMGIGIVVGTSTALCCATWLLLSKKK